MARPALEGALHLDLSVSAWAADGLLAIFFFVVGLELKREFVAGDLLFGQSGLGDIAGGDDLEGERGILLGQGDDQIARQPTDSAHRSGEECLRALAGLLGAPVDEPELAVRQGKMLASRLLPWARSGHLTVPRTPDFVLAPTERGAIDNLRLTTDRNTEQDWLKTNLAKFSRMMQGEQIGRAHV